jgi:hypothetical protein
MPRIGGSRISASIVILLSLASSVRLTRCISFNGSQNNRWLSRHDDYSLLFAVCIDSINSKSSLNDAVPMLNVVCAVAAIVVLFLPIVLLRAPYHWQLRLATTMSSRSYGEVLVPAILLFIQALQRVGPLDSFHYFSLSQPPLLPSSLASPRQYSFRPPLPIQYPHPPLTYSPPTQPCPPHSQ